MAIAGQVNEAVRMIVKEGGWNESGTVAGYRDRQEDKEDERTEHFQLLKGCDSRTEQEAAFFIRSS